MPIDWSQLQAIQPPRVVGSLPQTQSNGVDSLAGGVMSGLMQGQQMQSNNLAMQATRQQMGQSAETHQLTMQQAQQAQADSQTMRNAATAQDPVKAAVQGYQQIGRPDLAMGLLTSQQAITSSILGDKHTVQTMNIEEKQQKQKEFAFVGDMAFPILQAPKELQIGAYDKMYPQFKKFAPDAPSTKDSPEAKVAFLQGAASAAVGGLNMLKLNPPAVANLYPEGAQQQAKQDIINAQQKDIIPTDVEKNSQEIARLTVQEQNKTISKENQIKLDQMRQSTNKASELAPTELEKLQKTRDQLKNKIDKGTATSAEKADYTEINSKITKDTQAGLTQLPGQIANSAVDTVKGAINSVSKMFSPKTQVAPKGRVLVKSPDGTIGHIPISQLDEAMKNGYIKVK